ncbi:hypothetical protein JOC37_001356 [Desulfohalotomaculum tongense]|uniref:hypothetical protein n=1 Tax=Desulforadius tongensis TaxID=1216062 RepID=UPI00195C8FB0|nr:hypothetical protein [Desulforadius tongensis]MBM7854976.1 hypothetical protein [Desulforadius tongensis]
MQNARISNLLDIQQSLNKMSKNKFNEWLHFRNQNEFIIKEVIQRYNIKTNKLLLLGAGNGNDLPLNYIENTFDYIEIVDIDENALNRLLSKVNNTDKFNKIICDLTGLEKDVNILNEINSTDNIHEKVSLIEKLKPNPNLSDISYDFDLVINCNFSTQLLLPILPNYGFQSLLLGDLAIALGNLSEQIHKKLFEQIHNHLNSNGMLIHSTDTFELSKMSPAFEPILAVAGTINNTVNIDLRYLKIFMEQGLGIIGYQIPANTFKLFEFKTLFKALWHFNNSKAYLVLLWILKLKPVRD